MGIRGIKIRFQRPWIPDSAELPLLFLLLFLPSYLNQQPLPPALFDSPAYQIQILIQSLLILFLTLYLLRKNPPPEEISRKPMMPEISPAGGLLVLAGLAVLFLLYNVGLHLLQTLGLPVHQNDPVLITRPFMLIPALAVCMASAQMEEFFFRGYGYFRLIQSGAGSVPALVVINLLFAAGHLYEGSAAAVFALISGIFFSLAMRKGISLFSLGCAHGIFNFAVILISYFR